MVTNMGSAADRPVRCGYLSARFWIDSNLPHQGSGLARIDLKYHTSGFASGIKLAMINQATKI